MMPGYNLSLSVSVWGFRVAGTSDSGHVTVQSRAEIMELMHAC